MKKRKVVSWQLLLLLSLPLGACSTMETASRTDLDALQTQLTQTEKELTDKESQVSMLEAQLEEQTKAFYRTETRAIEAEARVENLQKIQARRLEGEQLLPPKAKTGECFARVFVPPAYELVNERTLTKDASEKIETIPAKFETVTEKILVEGPSEKIKIFPATYEWVEEDIVVKEATTKLLEMPAVYETTTEKVLVKPAHTVWKKGRGPIQRIDEATGEIMCLVEVPDEYKTVTKQVLKQPASTKEIKVPAVMKTIRKRVMKTSPRTQVVTIPAKYDTIRVTKLVQPPMEKRVEIPPQFQTVTKKVKVSDGHMEWQPILCETNMTSKKITDIQRALKHEGFNPGPIDGVVGPLTMKAVNMFQEKRGLLVSKYLSIDTVRALGIHPQQ